MGRKKTHTPEEIVAKLRQVEVLTAQGKAVAEAVRSIGVTEQTFYRWRAEFGGLKLDQVKRLKQLEAENARLRKAVSDLTLEKVTYGTGGVGSAPHFATAAFQQAAGIKLSGVSSPGLNDRISRHESNLPTTSRPRRKLCVGFARGSGATRNSSQMKPGPGMANSRCATVSSTSTPQPGRSLARTQPSTSSTGFALHSSSR